jgi:toxin ParE1/3/4
VRIELSAFVESDLEAIAVYIAEGNPRRALSFLREIREKFAMIARDPLLYRVRTEIGVDARVGLVGRYVILFRIVGQSVRIERVIYGGRDLVELMDEET